jgi:hypothetical protein
MNLALSGPGIHGGMVLFLTTRAMSAARAVTSFASVSLNGAMPPSLWQPAHWASIIGCTSLWYVGQMLERDCATCGLEGDPFAASATTPISATAASVPTKVNLAFP